MSADPRAAPGDIAQQRVEFGAVLSVVKRINPHQHAVGREKLLAHLRGKRLVVHRRLGLDAERRQFFKDAVKAVVLRCRGLPGGAVAAPEDRDAVGFHGGHVGLPGTLADAASGAELGRPAV